MPVRCVLGNGDSGEGQPLCCSGLGTTYSVTVVRISCTVIICYSCLCSMCIVSTGKHFH